MIFVFEAGVPQNGQEIFACYIEDDGLETVKNQGRQDIKGKWQAIEDKWIKIIENPICNEANEVKEFLQIIDPKIHLSYQLPESPFVICEEDFIKTIMDYEMFKREIDIKEFGNALLQRILYNSKTTLSDGNINIVLKKDEGDECD